MAAHPTLKIKLNKGSASHIGEGKVQPTPSESRTISCPDHLVLADLPVGRRVGAPPRAALVVKTVGRIASRSLGERVHFCLKCDFPIAVYGRLSPCTHAFCLDCANSGSNCYVCDKMIEKIQSIKRGEPLFICSVKLCLKSFMAKSEFESHVEEVHSQSLNNKMEEDKGAESDATIQLPAAAASASTTVGVPPLLPKPAPALASTTVGFPPLLPKPPVFASPIPVVQIHDRDDTPLRPVMRDETYAVPVPLMRQPRPPCFEPALEPSPNAPFDISRLNLGPTDHEPSALGLPPNSNMQAQPWGMGLLPPPIGVPPTVNPPAPHPRQSSRNQPSPRRRQPHHSRRRNN